TCSRCTRRQELREQLPQARPTHHVCRGDSGLGCCSKIRIAVHGLEQVFTAVADVTGLKRRVLGDLALDSESPGMDPVRTKVIGNVGFVLSAWIKGVGLNCRLQLVAYIWTSWHCGQH